MYDNEKCKDCDSRLKCLTGEQWLCSKSDTSLYTYNKDWILNPVLNVEGDIQIRGKSLESIIDERIQANKFSWKKLLKRWL